ncbi:MAG: Fic family protein [Acidobacteria bacterium]|nr:Fic family protein [Acidobacteriota bacterium]
MGRTPVGVDLDTDGLAAVIDLAAWAHAEWVRIHPFANGNGRTARVWANWIFVRYGFPPAVRLRPRPESGYGAACARAMATDGSSLPRHGARRYGAADLSGNVNHHVPELSTDRWRAPSNRSTWTTRSAPSVTRSASSVSRPSSPPRPF